MTVFGMFYRSRAAKNPFMYIFVYYNHAYSYTIIYLKYRVYCSCSMDNRKPVRAEVVHPCQTQWQLIVYSNYTMSTMSSITTGSLAPDTVHCVRITVPPVVEVFLRSERGPRTNRPETQS